MSEQGGIQRAILPILDRPQVGLVTYDAKDPATRYPPIDPAAATRGRPNVLVVLIDDVGFGLQRVRWAVPDTELERSPTAGCATTVSTPRRCARRRGRRCWLAATIIRLGWVASPRLTAAPGNSSLRPNTKAPLAETLG